MPCDRCNQSERVRVRRAKLAERDGKVAVVLGVPMEEYPACGDRWLPWDVAQGLDELLTAMLAGDVEVPLATTKSSRRMSCPPRTLRSGTLRHLACVLFPDGSSPFPSTLLGSSCLVG